MATTRKHYTEVERHLFLNILKKFKHIIENKKNDSATLKDKDEAWREINEEYNSSLGISTKRTVKQLKKWWSNLKTDQRAALTSERQARIATERRNAVLDNEYLEEYLMEKSDSEIDDNNVSKSTSEPETLNVKHCLKSTTKLDVTDIDHMLKTKIKEDNKQENNEEKDLKLERIRRIIQHEEKLAAVKLQHEIKKQKIEIKHLQEKNSLEIRAATASAALAELLLQKASEKYE